jgi:hypothetical protein
MSNQKNTPVLRISSQEAEMICTTIVNMVLWANEGGDSEYAKKIIDAAISGIPTWANVFQVRPLVAEKLQENRVKEMLSAKADDASVHDVECEMFRNDWECESFRQMWSGPEATADRAAAKDAGTEEKDGKNRGLMHQAKAYGDMTTAKILVMESVVDQYELGLIDKRIARWQLVSVYNRCHQMLKQVRWIFPVSGQFPRGLIKGQGYSVSALKAMANVAIEMLEELGYKLSLMPKHFEVQRDSKGVVVLWETNWNGQEEMSGDDWNKATHRAFYEDVLEHDLID